MWGDGNFLAPKNLIKHFKNFWSQKNLIKHPYEKVDAWVTFIFYWLLKHPEYIFKIAPIKNTFLETVFSKNINLIYSIYSSSESSEELSKSSICLITFSEYIYRVWAESWTQNLSWLLINKYDYSPHLEFLYYRNM